ncbi:hypothetical protein L1049_010937 [Liquidambar formosana]|uniref:Disease resistance RPP13-like protein 1 n=1 Tax=Liquidambar formosana TaxID=63359 RepID=A0AAP0RQ95_LIQFO
MAELVGGAFLSATLQVLFDRMASSEVLDFFRRRKLDDGLLKKLEITLLAVNAVLDDAEEKQSTNPAVKKWHDELKDAVYNAEDLLDQIATEALQSKLETGSQTLTTQVWGFISTLNPFDEGITSKIKKVIENIESFEKKNQSLGLSKKAGRKPSRSSPTSSVVDESGVYGREADKEKITKLLLSDDATDKGTCVITIVGLGGVGKTTLAQLLYNDKKVEEYFHTKAWVCVSEEFDVLRVTKTILESVNEQTRAKDDLNSLQVELKKSLIGKKFLFVLDDIWNVNYSDWNKLCIPFGVGDKGCKIIVTTRLESVALSMCTIPIHYLGQLSDAASWSLFEKHAFSCENPDAHPNKAIIGKKIVEKCKGLPLAIITLGGLLKSKPNAEEWKDILESNIWEIPDDEILPALRLSYLHLPAHLKQCFAYCSIFPKDYPFKKEKLVLLWMAEGFVQQLKSGERMEKVGDKYFCELLSRSFFQQSSRDKSRFVMHDLINDLAQSVSGEFCYMLEGNKSDQISGKVRHFSYFMERYDSHKKLGPFCEIKCLRTFLPFVSLLGYPHPPQLTNKVLNDLLTTLSCLRVLSLSHYENITELPDSIGNLKQLRYLDLSRTKIERLPKVIRNLCNLQTLMLSKCSSLSVLPSNIGKLTNLRHLDTSGTNLTEMPIQMNALRSLQTLTTFVVGKHVGLGVGKLSEFRHLRGRLSILKLQNVVDPMDAWNANLNEKKHLDELHLEWGCDTDDSHNERDVLDKLRPSTNLRRLTLKYYGGTSFPIWLGDRSFSNMTVFYLEDCMHCLSLPPLGQLPSLVELSIRRISLVERVGLEFYGSGSTSIGPFQKLKTLRFEGMSEWEEWSFVGVEGEIFPSLKVLSIRDCPKLRGDLPNHLPSLKELVISECYQLEASIPNDATSIRKLKLRGCKEVLLSSIADRTSLESLQLYGFREPFTSPVNRDVLNSLFHGLTSLKYLDMAECSTSLLLFPETGLPSMLQSLEISSCFTQTSFPEGMLHLCTRLQSLTIKSCPRLESFSRGGLPTTLKTLFISECEKLELVPAEAEETHNHYASLERLQVWYSCDSLKSFPLGLFPKLNYLQVLDCKNLESLCISEEGLHDYLTSLDYLNIISCPKFVSFPKGGLPTPNLTSFGVFDCKNLKSLPENMHTLLPSLQELKIWVCPELESFPEGGLPSNLIQLEVCYCDKLTACWIDWGLHTLPEKWLLPSALTTLEISIPNLKHLDKRGFQHLTSLQKLHIWHCPQLQSLPEEGLPASLYLLSIWNCPLLEQRCQREKGEEWPKIAHIPCIVIDEKLIS